MKRYCLPITLIFIAGMLRVARHFGFLDLPPNFAPITAVALFAGSIFYKEKFLSILIPIAAMVISDFFIGFYHLGILLSVYGSFVVAVMLGWWAGKRGTVQPVRIVGSVCASSFIFYIVTNAAVWWFGTMYPHTGSGLMQSYFMALPFFKWSLASDMFYTAVLFSAYALAVFLKNRGVLLMQRLFLWRTKM